MKRITDLFKNLRPSNPDTREYRLMYFVGCWITKSKLYAESDAEAIFDARKEVKQDSTATANIMPFALWCGRRLVKQFNYFGEACSPEYTTIK